MKYVPERTTSRVLHALLEAGVRYSPTYPPDGNSDHLPMALCALAGLGADDDQLHAFARQRSAWQVRAEAPDREVVDPRDHLGDHAAYPALLQTLRHRIAEAGREAVAAELIPGLLPGLAAEAFHALLRLGYALRFGSDVEVAAGLAYMITSYVQVPQQSPAGIHIRAAALAQVDAPTVKFEEDRFGARLGELVSSGRYPSPPLGGLDDIASLSLQIYRGTRDFFALHLVTATQAGRELARVVGEQPVVQALGPAVLAAHQIVGSPAFDTPLAAPAGLDPEHGIKYVYSCLVEMRHRGSEVYAEEIRAFEAQGLLSGWVSGPVV